MRTVALSVAAVATLTVATGVGAAALSTHPRAAIRHAHTHHRGAVAAAPNTLASTITDLQPYVYWPLNGTSSDQSGNGRPGLTTTGTGPALGHDASNPAGSDGGSTAFAPSARQTGQYLQSTGQPVPLGSKGTLVVWFRLPAKLPTWWQTLIVDNGAGTGYGAGLFITNTGRLALTDSAGTYDPLGNFGPRKRTVTGPLNDGRWHMAAFVDQYNVDTSPPIARGDFRPSLIYVDGRLVDGTVEGRLFDGFSWNAQSRLLIGAGQTNQITTEGKYAGSVSNVALFTRLLTANQIAAIWQAGN